MGRVDLIIGKCRSMAIAVIQNEYRMFYGEKKFDKKNLENKKKIDAGQKNDARGDDKLMFFFNAPNVYRKNRHTFWQKII